MTTVVRAIILSVLGRGGGGGCLHQKQKNQKVGVRGIYKEIGWEGFQNKWFSKMLMQSHSGTCLKEEG